MELRKIKALLIERGIKIKDIAKKAGVEPVTVSVVITGKGKSANIQKTISRELRIPYEKLWGKAALMLALLYSSLCLLSC